MQMKRLRELRRKSTDTSENPPNPKPGHLLALYNFIKVALTLLYTFILNQALRAWLSKHTQPTSRICLDRCVAQRTEELNSISATLQQTYETLEQRVEERAQRLHRRNRELALIHRVGQVFSSSLEMDAVLAKVLSEVRGLFKATGTSVWLIDPETDDIVCQQAVGIPGKQLKGWRLPPEQGIVGWTVRHQKSVLISNAYEDSRHFEGVDRYTGIPILSILSVPLRVRHQVTGALQVVDKRESRYTLDDRRLLENLATSAAIAIENAKLYEAAQQEIVRRKQSEQRYRTLVETSPDSISVTDLDGNLVISNPQTARLYGFGNLEKVQQLRTADFIAPKDRERAAQNRQRTLEEGLMRNIEYTMLRKDGSRFLAELSSALIVDVQGQPEGFIDIVRDITQRKRVEDTLRQRNRELLALNTVGKTLNRTQELQPLLQEVLNAVLSVVELNAGWIHLIENDAANSEVRLVAQLGFPTIDDLSFQEAQRNSLAISRHIIETGRPLILDSTSDAEWLDLSYWRDHHPLPALACFPLLSGKKILGAMGISNYPSRPISPQEVQILRLTGQQIGVTIDNIYLAQAAAEVEVLRELDQLRAELVANFSHDLRTPLGLIKIACTTLLREDIDFDPETYREFLHDIESEADRLTSIVDHVLDLGKMENGHLSLACHPTHMIDLVENIMNAMAPRSTQHTFVCKSPSNPLIARVDASRIEEVLRNLLDNAIKYSPQGGTITVSGRETEREILIQVTDEGIGIKQSELNQVFERYYRSDNPAIRHIRGVGLGLAVCKGIIEAHGGKIWAESHLQQGSTFSFTIPQEVKS